MSTKISLSQQIDEVHREMNERRKVYPHLIATRKMRQSLADFHMERLDGILWTLQWLRTNEIEIKAFMALPAEDRAVIVSHGPLVAQLAAELVKREAIAEAGGPVR